MDRHFSDAFIFRLDEGFGLTELSLDYLRSEAESQRMFNRNATGVRGKCQKP